MANQFLALSLFIMLLSFFLILNGLSDFENVKARPVLNSIAMAFSSETLTEEELEANVEASVEQSFREGDTLDRLEAMFRAQITGVEADKNRLGTVMHIRVKVSDFESSLMAPSPAEVSRKEVFSGVRGPLVPTLVSLLQSPEAGVPYRMDLVLNMAASPSKVQNEQPQITSDHVKKVALYTQKLEEAGLPKKLVTAGLGPGPEKTIDLYFRRYEPFNPLGETKKE